MIIWRGWGILALLIPVVVWAIVPELVKPVFPQGQYPDYYQYVSAFSILLGATALWFLGRRLNSGGRALIDEATGERILLKPDHSLFFIKMEFWAIPLALFAIFLLVA